MATSVAVLETALGQRDVSIRFFSDVAFGGSVTVSFSDDGIANDSADERVRLIAKARDIIGMVVREQEPAPADMTTRAAIAAAITAK